MNQARKFNFKTHVEKLNPRFKQQNATWHLIVRFKDTLDSK